MTTNADCQPTLTNSQTTTVVGQTSTLASNFVQTKNEMINCPTGYKPNPVYDPNCPGLSLTGAALDQCFINSIVNEVTNIGAADVNVFKLLGIHEQGKLIDLVGKGKAVSGGDALGFPKENAFTAIPTEWRSVQRGTNILSSSYIGYDFGNVLLESGVPRYGINELENTAIRHDVAMVRIKQGLYPHNRVSKVRVERSQDGSRWYGVALLDLPDVCDMVEVSFNHSVPSRYWRVRPLAFSGGSNDVWIVQGLQLIDYDVTSLDDIQDKILPENRDRDYSVISVKLKATYDLLDTLTEFSAFGLDLPNQQFFFHIPFTSAIQILGRPPVIGDIFELPSEAQYDPRLNKILKYLEVTDVTWSTDGYTPGWVPTILRVVAVPMLASRETQSIVGDLAEKFDNLGTAAVDDGHHPSIQDLSEFTQTIASVATTNSPVVGSDTREIVHFTQEQIDAAALENINLAKLNIATVAYLAEDGMPKDGSTYTEGDTFPTNPSDEDYHRLTYSGTAGNIPVRLFRFSLEKNRWIYLETDRRKQFNHVKPLLQEFLTSPNKIPSRKIENDNQS